ncbi:MAG: hypothetical protein U1E13_01895 [Methylophilaceae bacterium]|nr:hypothetical protein [Methylophilaceae bacterium]
MNQLHLRHYVGLVLLMLLMSLSHISLVHAAEAGKTIVAADLKQQPFIDAPTISKLPANTELEVLARQGGWMQVKAGAEEGWLKMTAIKLGTGDAQGKSGSGLGTLFNIATTGRSGSSGVTVATGVRGLGQEELKNAQPNHEAVKKMEAFVGAKNEVTVFATSANLKSQSLEYLGVAATSPTNGANMGGGR